MFLNIICLTCCLRILVQSASSKFTYSEIGFLLGSSFIIAQAIAKNKCVEEMRFISAQELLGALVKLLYCVGQCALIY